MVFVSTNPRFFLCWEDRKASEDPSFFTITLFYVENEMIIIGEYSSLFMYNLSLLCVFMSLVVFAGRFLRFHSSVQSFVFNVTFTLD